MFKRAFRRTVCLLAAAVLILPQMLPAVPADQHDGAVTLRTVSDLLELAKNCTLDTWSQGRVVRLEADLDLSGSGFTPIPTFGGTFQGNNHTIYGLSITGDGSHQGLFRYLVFQEKQRSMAEKAPPFGHVVIFQTRPKNSPRTQDAQVS